MSCSPASRQHQPSLHSSAPRRSSLGWVAEIVRDDTLPSPYHERPEYRDEFSAIAHLFRHRQASLSLNHCSITMRRSNCLKRGLFPSRHAWHRESATSRRYRSPPLSQWITKTEL